MAGNPRYTNLGNPVSSTEQSWMDLAIRAWGGEWNAPDHGAYVFSNGRSFDSTDQTNNGFYTNYAAQGGTNGGRFTLDVSVLGGPNVLG